MYDLRSFLEEEKDNIFNISVPINLNQEITAIQQELDSKGDFPIIYVEKPKFEDGNISKIPIVCNLTASRDVTSRALGIENHKNFAKIYSNLTNDPIEPIIISRESAPVQEKIIHNNDVNLLELPVLTQHQLDPGPYLTSAHATTYDPDTNVDNTSIQRCWVKKKNKMSYYPYPASHNMRNLKKFWNRGEACPVAFWIGHHPKVLMGTQAKLSYPESHWSACGGLLGESLRLVPSITHGEKVLVPADAEIVIEGYAPVNKLEADGPFGEYTGYIGPQVPSPICEVTCITMRNNPIYHDYGSGHADMLVPDNMVMEGKIYSIVKPIAPSVQRVHVPVSGRRFHAYVQCKSPKIGEVRDALMATLSYRRTKAIIFVDDDIDIFSDSEIMFALATRVQWDRDTISVNGLQGSLMDPSIVRGAKTVQKIGIDATLAPSEIPDTPAPIPPKNSVEQTALENARLVLSNINKDNWPKI